MSEPRAKRPRRERGNAYRATSPAKLAAYRATSPARSLALPPAEAEALARNHERIEERRTRRG